MIISYGNMIYWTVKYVEECFHYHIWDINLETIAIPNSTVILMPPEGCNSASWSFQIQYRWLLCVVIHMSNCPWLIIIRKAKYYGWLQNHNLITFCNQNKYYISFDFCLYPKLKDSTRSGSEVTRLILKVNILFQWTDSGERHVHSILHVNLCSYLKPSIHSFSDWWGGSKKWEQIVVHFRLQCLILLLLISCFMFVWWRHHNKTEFLLCFLMAHITSDGKVVIIVTWDGEIY